MKMEKTSWHWHTGWYWLPFKVLGALIASWLLVHALAIFGWFVSVGYSAWGLLVKKPPLAGRKAFTYSLVIIALSILSFGMVYAESRILESLGLGFTKKTVTFSIEDKGKYRLGEIFPMKIDIAGVEKPVNAVQADLSFNPDQLEVVDISTIESFASVFIQKELNNEAGYARLTGGLPNPGFFSDHGTFGTVLFRGNQPGLAQIKFLPTSMVLANDGKGTNILKEFATVSYLILPEKLSKEEEELQAGLIAENRVLGAQTENTQMTFYNEPSVLGAWTQAELSGYQEKTGGVLGAADVKGASDDFTLLHHFDAWIVNIWQAVFDWFTGLFK